MTVSLTQELTQARAKVAELEKLLRGDLKGKYVILTSDAEANIDEDVFYKVNSVDADLDDTEPVQIVTLDECDYAWVSVTDVEVLTYESARKLLITDAERRLSDYFPEGAVD